MKKRVLRLKTISWFFALLCASFVLLWISLPKLLQTTIEAKLADLDAKLSLITIDKINPWAISLSDLQVLSEEGNFSLQQGEARYDPFSLTEGKIHAVSLTSPDLHLQLPKLMEHFSRAVSPDTNDGNFQSSIEKFLAEPPVRHFRMRDALVNLNSGANSLKSGLAIEGDFFPYLAQLRMDGNLTGLPWLGDLTLVQEGTDLFLGASLYFPQLSKISQAMYSIFTTFNLGNGLDTRHWVKIDHGTAKGQWTGRVEEDGIIDQFMDFNVSDLVVQTMGVTFTIPQAILFITPHSPTWIESNFYANLNWGENLEIQGLKLSADIRDGKPNLALRVKRLRSQGILPQAEIVGLVIDNIEFSFGEDGEFTGIRKAKLRFSSLHFQEGLGNLYDGELSLIWLGEDRFELEFLKANGSLPTLGLNLYNLGYVGEVALDSIPKLEKTQAITIEEAYIGEDQRIEDMKLEYKLESLDRLEISKLSMRVNDFEFFLDPANFLIEIPESSQEPVGFSVFDGKLQLTDYEDFTVKNIQANIKLNSLDPLETNGSQKIRFDLHAGEQVLPDGEIRFELLNSGEKFLDTIELQAFGGRIATEKIMIEEDFENLQFRVHLHGLDSQEFLSLFEELDARMDGNFSGALSIRNDPFSGWDFYGGAISLDSSDSAKLYLNTKGILTDGLEPKSPEYKNMYLLEKALQNLDLESLNIVLKVIDNGERIVEMNVRGESEVDGKSISVEYRPKVVGGLDALIHQVDLSKWGITQ